MEGPITTMSQCCIAARDFALGDLSGDGYPDLAIATGYMSLMMKASERSVLYLNDGGRRMWDVSAGSGFDDPALGISVAVSDINRDGRPDLFLANTNASNRLFLNREPGGNFVHLDLRGLVSNSYGLGAEVTALVGGKPFKAVVQPGGEYASSSEPGMTIGLGSSKAAQRVTVMWPSGMVQALGDLPAGTWKTVKEPAGAVVDAGPDGTASSSTEVMLHGTLHGTALAQPSYSWIFHGPTGDQTLPGKDVMFAPVAPGVYSAEFTVLDRFGALFGSDFCIMRVSDTTAPTIDVQMPPKATTAAAVVFNGSNITDNDPAFKAGGKVEWTFRNGANTVTATGFNPSVKLVQPGRWNMTVKATDLSGNVATRSIEFQVTGIAPPPINFEMVAWAIAFVALTIIGLAVASTRIFRGAGAQVPLADISEIQPSDIRGPHIDAALEDDDGQHALEEE